MKSSSVNPLQYNRKILLLLIQLLLLLLPQQFMLLQNKIPRLFSVIPLNGITVEFMHVNVTWIVIDFKNIHMKIIASIYTAAVAAAAESLQSCLTLCDPRDGSPPGSPVPGILQARTLEWVAISFSNAWKWKVKVKSLSHVWLLATPWTAAYQAPPSVGFSRQEYWSGVPLPSAWIYTNICHI